MNVEKRLEKLERVVTQFKPAIIFRVIVDEKGEPIHVKAWKGSNGVLVSRKPGESDDELSQRAIDAAGGVSMRFLAVI